MKIGTAITVVGITAGVTAVTIFAPVAAIKAIADVGIAAVVGLVLVYI